MNGKIRGRRDKGGKNNERRKGVMVAEDEEGEWMDEDGDGGGDEGTVGDQKGDGSHAPATATGGAEIVDRAANDAPDGNLAGEVDDEIL